METKKIEKMILVLCVIIVMGFAAMITEVTAYAETSAGSMLKIAALFGLNPGNNSGEEFQIDGKLLIKEFGINTAVCRADWSTAQDVIDRNHCAAFLNWPFENTIADHVSQDRFKMLEKSKPQSTIACVETKDGGSYYRCTENIAGYMTCRESADGSKYVVLLDMNGEQINVEEMPADTLMIMTCMTKNEKAEYGVKSDDTTTYSRFTFWEPLP